jgi:hypothetical protein
MDYYFQKNYSSIFANEYKAELTKSELIVSYYSADKEVVLSKIKYQTIYKISLRKYYVPPDRYRKEYGYWQYSCVIHSNYATPTTILCPINGYNRRNYLIFVNYLHTCCSDINHIDYAFYDETHIAQIGLNWYGVIYVIFSSIIITGFYFLATHRNEITFLSVIIAFFLPVLLNPALKDIGKESAYGTYQNDEIPDSVLP